jgi:hypothetical protein
MKRRKNYIGDEEIPNPMKGPAESSRVLVTTALCENNKRHLRYHT